MIKRHTKLCICIRCHDYPEFVLDEVDSVFYHSTTLPHVMLALDRGPHKDTAKQNAVAKLVTKHFPQVHIYKSPFQWGWGAGMYGLLCEAIDWAQANLKFDHFLSLDYDALFIGKGADESLIADAEEENVGLVGTVTPIGKTWGLNFEKKWGKIMKMTSGRKPASERWSKRCVYGAVMCLSKLALGGMRKLGYFDPPFRNIKKSLAISDDPWLTFLTLCAGYYVKDNKKYCYNVWKSPEDYRLKTHRQPWLKIWHPAKMGPGGRPTNHAAERLCRNFFRQKRGRKALQL